MLLLPVRFCIRSLLFWLILAGCERKKAPATAETPASEVPPKLLSDKAAAAPAADTATEIAQESSSGDIPALHIPFEERWTLAPGLVVIIMSIRPADTAIIREPSDLKLTFTIKRNNQIIYRDTANDGLMYDYYAMPTTKKLYPIWLPTGEGNGELLVAFNNRPFIELVRRFFIYNNQISRIDTLPAFKGPAKDVDKDGQMEFSGAMSSSEMWDDKHGKRHISYDPTLYYEVRPTGLVVDSALTRQKIKAEYGVFKGFKYAEHLDVLVDDLPKGSPKRP